MIKGLKGTNLIAVDGIDKTVNISGKYKELGIVTKGKIGFDVEPYVEGKIVPNLRCSLYKNYQLSVDNLDYFDKIFKEESFYSLLAANGIYFENPLGEKPNYNQYNYQDDEEKYFKNDISEWQSYEEKQKRQWINIIVQNV